MFLNLLLVALSPYVYVFLSVVARGDGPLLVVVMSFLFLQFVDALFIQGCHGQEKIKGRQIFSRSGNRFMKSGNF